MLPSLRPASGVVVRKSLVGLVLTCPNEEGIRYRLVRLLNKAFCIHHYFQHTELTNLRKSLFLLVSRVLSLRSIP